MARPRGRPVGTTKLTPERQAKIVEALKAGNYLEVAARFAGIDNSTLTLWRQRGEREKSGVFYEFFIAVNQAIAAAEAAAVVSIRQQFGADWRSAAWFLEHGQMRQRWAPLVKVDIARMEDHEIVEALALASPDTPSDSAGHSDPSPDGGGAPA